MGKSKPKQGLRNRLTGVRGVTADELRGALSAFADGFLSGFTGDAQPITVEVLSPVVAKGRPFDCDCDGPCRCWMKDDEGL